MAAPRYMSRTNGVSTDQAAAVVSTANAIVGTNSAGTLDPSFFGAGIGQDTVTMPASEALAAGAIVNIWSNSGVANARNADSGTASAGKAYDGFVLAAVASSGTATIYRSGQNNQLSGLTPGSLYYLGASGAVSATASSTSGTTAQQLGRAISATVLDCQPLPPIAVT